MQFNTALTVNNKTSTKTNTNTNFSPPNLTK